MSKLNKSEYRAGDESEAGETIKLVIGSCPHFIVFQVEDNGIRWEVDDAKTPPHMGTCLELYDKVESLINFYCAGVNRVKYTVSNGRALFVSVTNQNPVNLSAFTLIHDRIVSELQTFGRFQYVGASTIITVLACLVTSFIHEYELAEKLFPFYLGGSMGAIGALLSIYQRCNAIDIASHTSPSQHSFLGTSRIILGILCGGLLVLVVQANLFMGIASQSLAALSVFCAVAGFSERYFPSMLDEIQTKNSLKSGEKELTTELCIEVEKPLAGETVRASATREAKHNDLSA